MIVANVNRGCEDGSRHIIIVAIGAWILAEWDNMDFDYRSVTYSYLFDFILLDSSSNFNDYID